MNDKPSPFTQLHRDMLDLSLSNEVQAMMAEKINKWPQPVGTALATFALCIANQLGHLDVDPHTRYNTMCDVFRFIHDLTQNGWAIPQSEKEKMN